MARAFPGVFRKLGRSGAAVLVLLLVAPFGLTLMFRTSPRIDLLFESPRFHLVAVSAIAACALLVALLTAVVAARVRQPAPVLLALGCLFVGVPMLGHGLTTPGILDRPLSLWVARFPVLAIAGFAFCLSAATSREGAAVKRLVGRFPRACLVLVTLTLTAGSALVVVRPTAAMGTRPIPGETALTHIVLIASAVALLVAGGAHWRRWRLGWDRVDLALVLACWLSVDATASFELGQLWRLSWWDYHAYLLAGFAAAAWAVGTEYRRTRSAVGALATVTFIDPMQHIARGYPEALKTLTAAVEAKDSYTHGHSDRVAEFSTRMGLRLGLDPDDLRGLVQGAQLHDIGKIGVPDEVLNKPGSLTPEEWTWIEAHPVVGWEMASKAPSLNDSLAVVRHHHERWDGTGYPDHLSAEEIPVVARIAAVADVWDALTSDRAYRPAWAPDKALAHIAAASGKLFDPSSVEAFVDLVADRGLWPERADFDPEALLAAAEACHPRPKRRVSPQTRSA